ncbi:MAG: DUF4102 domain-containing protein [Campylobacterales bacterium]|nr:DUF4102 domain-containing protein [Campylobacterales bacterium]
MNELSNTQLKKLKLDPTKKITKYSDGEGLHFLGKSWGYPFI